MTVWDLMNLLKTMDPDALIMAEGNWPGLEMVEPDDFTSINVVGEPIGGFIQREDGVSAILILGYKQLKM